MQACAVAINRKSGNYQKNQDPGHIRGGKRLCSRKDTQKETGVLEVT